MSTTTNTKTLAEHGPFALIEDGQGNVWLEGPGRYVRKRGAALTEQLMAGADLLFNTMALNASREPEPPSIELLMLRRLQIDFAGWSGMAAFTIEHGLAQPPESDDLRVSEEPAPYAATNTALTRVLHEGVGACSAEELLAVLIWLPQAERIARELLAAYGSLDRLRAAQVQDIAKVRGLGLKSAGRLKAALEAGRRSAFAPPDTRPKITTPAEAAHLLLAELAVCEQEEVWTIHLDTRNRLISKFRVYIGSLNSASIRPADLFREAVRVNAASVILAHSHPSGDSQPSHDDLKVSKVIGDAGRLMEIPVLDHLIVCAGGRFTSLKERGVEM